jgi:hypothetical protein
MRVFEGARLFGGFLFGDFSVMRHGRIGQARVAGGTGHKRTTLALAVAALLSGCGGTTLNNPFSTAPPPNAEIPTIGERFDQLFGGSGKVPETASEGTEPDCPVVKIRAGASTYAVAPPGKQPIASELNFQATITRTARDCRRVGGQINARIGIQGRVIAGPAGAPATVEIPVRVAVVQAGVNERVISTKVYRTTVSMNDTGSSPFSVVGEDLIYNMPANLTSESFVFYIGFDPQAVTPPAPSRRR